MKTLKWIIVSLIYLNLLFVIFGFSEKKTFCVWALVDPDVEIETRYFEVYGTGHPIPDDGKFRNYIGTCQFMQGCLVFHVFEVLQKKK